MPDAAIDQLLRADARLSRSFAAAVAATLASIFWTFFIAERTPGGAFKPTWVFVVLALVQLATYIWYALVSGAAAKTLGEAGWKYIVWILVAPFLGLVPIPIVSTIISVSPLSIKFLLGGQLQSAIRQESVADLHR